MCAQATVRDLGMWWILQIPYGGELTSTGRTHRSLLIGQNIWTQLGKWLGYQHIEMTGENILGISNGISKSMRERKYRT